MAKSQLPIIFLPRMAQERVRSQVEAHWDAFNALADSQSGANEALIRALEVFEGEEILIFCLLLYGRQVWWVCLLVRPLALAPPYWHAAHEHPCVCGTGLHTRESLVTPFFLTSQLAHSPVLSMLKPASYKNFGKSTRCLPSRIRNQGPGEPSRRSNHRRHPPRGRGRRGRRGRRHLSQQACRAGSSIRAGNGRRRHTYLGEPRTPAGMTARAVVRTSGQRRR